MLQEPINTDKLQLLLDDPLYIETMGRFIADPLFDVVISEAERAQTDIPLYSLSEIYPDFRKVFKPIKTSKQEIQISSLVGSVEQQHQSFKNGFIPELDKSLEVQALVEQLKQGRLDSQQNPIRVHAIPSSSRFLGFVAGGADIVAAHLLAGKEKVWAEVTFYKQIGQ